MPLKEKTGRLNGAWGVAWDTTPELLARVRCVDAELILLDAMARV